ncbi:MAG: 50S rRNA methyltransferase [endosymbiont of Galathealinum brachiosum]|uniref:50S rRNA methyltransferase n=1 Tax=endosymbiont of Galathealinum brachiosum TaxID=2200906 RepID=A0A370D983_9GAMM|nr:MAG: 50S rRNA methyltransferase [endosymbiont of Galathealinum brachiosum]
MSENTFELPHNSPVEPTRLELEDKIKFQCHKGISCWNECCARADVSLAPYDIIRMKNHLNIESSEFLNTYTVPFEIDAHGIPGIKLRTTDDGACLFMKEEGCSIYEDRPTACRYYPSGLLSMRALGKSEDERHFLMVKEPHCKGHDEDREITIADYRKEQVVEEFDELNRDWYRIILKKKSTGPTIGAPSDMSLQLFFMASYDVDRFRRFVGSDSFKSMYQVTDEEFSKYAEDDIALMQFGFALMKQVLFGELTIKERDGAYDKRTEERKDILAYRKEVEIDKHNQKAEEARKAALDD